MLEANELCFPNNIVDVMAARVKQNFDVIDPSGETIVVKRSLTMEDADQTIGIVPVDWAPKGQPEIGRKPNQFEVPVQAYTIMLQALINDMNEDQAIRRHGLFSTKLRRMLYRDTVLLSALSQLEVIDDGVKEKTLQYAIRSQQFLVTQRDSSFQRLSVIEFYLETQTSSTT